MMHYVVNQNEHAIDFDEFVNSYMKPRHLSQYNLYRQLKAGIERACVKQSIIRHHGNLSSVARHLGMGRERVNRLVKSYDLTEWLRKTRYDHAQREEAMRERHAGYNY